MYQYKNKNLTKWESRQKCRIGNNTGAASCQCLCGHFAQTCVWVCFTVVFGSSKDERRTDPVTPRVSQRPELLLLSLLFLFLKTDLTLRTSNFCFCFLLHSKIRLTQNSSKPCLKQNTQARMHCNGCTVDTLYTSFILSLTSNRYTSQRLQCVQTQARSTRHFIQIIQSVETSATVTPNTTTLQSEQATRTTNSQITQGFE